MDPHREITNSARLRETWLRSRVFRRGLQIICPLRYLQDARLTPL